MRQERFDIQELRSMSKADLVSHWRGVFDSPAPRGVSTKFLRMALAWKLQVIEHGADTAKRDRRLRQIAEAIAEGRTPRVLAAPTGSRPGTTIARTWRGKVYTVTAIEDGFEHDGRTYASLSEIAREITGTRWNGPAFFGLRKGKSAKAAAGASRGQ